MINVKEIMSWNQNQKEHEMLVSLGLFMIIQKLFQGMIIHDASKWSTGEYEEFLDAATSLRASVDGKDADYQKHLMSGAIQHHITENEHHPEYWDKRGEPMPVHEIIIMYFDWCSRAAQKGTTLDAFWDFNLSKLKKQAHAIPVVEALRREYPPKLIKEKP
jgi:hypothetical protein